MVCLCFVLVLKCSCCSKERTFSGFIAVLPTFLRLTSFSETGRGTEGNSSSGDIDENKGKGLEPLSCFCLCAQLRKLLLIGNQALTEDPYPTKQVFLYVRTGKCYMCALPNP